MFLSILLNQHIEPAIEIVEETSTSKETYNLKWLCYLHVNEFNIVKPMNMTLLMNQYHVQKPVVG